MCKNQKIQIRVVGNRNHSRSRSHQAGYFWLNTPEAKLAKLAKIKLINEYIEFWLPATGNRRLWS